ncbi:MAG: hypothetical protein JWP81_975 [Ferruginibacter sp.]|nr:hypothetical protein [Ferruginibacter sp.]
MVEVFKTDVTEQEHANRLIARIHSTFVGYRANFDLDDRDRILRVKSISGSISSSCLVNLLREFGFHAEVLPDIIMTTVKVGCTQ